MFGPNRQYPTTARMKVEIDTRVCGGCGLCRETCPEIFELRDHKWRQVACTKFPDVPMDFEILCLAAAEQCPVDAILLGEVESAP